MGAVQSELVRADHRFVGGAQGRHRGADDAEEDETQDSVDEREAHLTDDVATDGAGDVFEEAAEGVALVGRDEAGGDMLHAAQRRHEVERQDQDDRDPGEAAGDARTHREHAAADVEEVVRVLHEAEDALHGIVDRGAELTADVLEPGAGHEVLDGDAAAEFRRHTENDLVERRIRDARRVLAGLDMSLNEPVSGHVPHAVSDPQAPFDVVLDHEAGEAWMRTLAAVRLVVASRLGIETEDDDAEARADDDEDGRFGVYDWLGFRLDGIVQALDDSEL